MSRKKLLIIDDEKLIRWSVTQKLSEWNIDVIEAEDGHNAIPAIEEKLPDLIMLDVNLPDIKGTALLLEIKEKWPDIPVIMITAFGSIEDAVTAMRRGAYDFITKPIDFLKLQGTINHALETVSLKTKIAYYEEREQKKFDLSHIIAKSQTMQEILDMTETVAQSETIIVLLQGESGTGKDLLAQAIHHLSRRRQGPYLVINCSAIPETLLESELFGYEKGAFTDAKQRKKGLVELASGGTLFLDEIGTLSLSLQAKLLRFLETQSFKRVGGLKDIEVDIRVIAATNQDLKIASDEGSFRKDLYYRLNVCPIHIPPLREHRKDILPLAANFIRQDNIKFKKKIKGLNKKTQEIFLQYDWPGNVRELKNAVERAMIFEKESLISPQHIPIRLETKPSFSPNYDLLPTPDGSTSLAGMEKSMLLSALQKAGGNKSKAARILKISRDTLRYKIKKFNISSERYS